MSTATHPVRRPRISRRTLLVLAGLLVVIAAAITVPLLVRSGGAATPTPAAPVPAVQQAPDDQPVQDPCELPRLGRPLPC